MTTTLFHLAIGLLICACVLIAPHASQRAGNAGSIAFSLLSGISIAAFVGITMEWI